MCQVAALDMPPPRRLHPLARIPEYTPIPDGRLEDLTELPQRLLLPGPTRTLVICGPQ